MGPRARSAPNRKLGPLSIAATLLLASSCGFTGCKTSHDAAEAASQMSETAKALADYYTGVEAILENSDAINIINRDLYNKPYSDKTQADLKKLEAELAKRAALASNLSALAASFSQLTTSTAPADVSASAGNLLGLATSLTSYTPTTAQQTAITDAVQDLVAALKEHKEREAARAMDGAVHGLADLFDKEQNVWLTLEQTNAEVSSTLAGSLVDANATDNMQLLKVALKPFGLAPAAVSQDMNLKLAAEAKDHIRDKKADMESSFAQATSDMSKSLHTMAGRIDTVASDKPLNFHSTPVTVAPVEQWAAQVTAAK
jgi:hypothetical protein